MNDPRRGIPSVDALLSAEPFVALGVRYGRGRVRDALRATLEGARTAEGAALLPSDPSDPGPWAEAVAVALERDDAPSLTAVVNATGVVLHTNLGRAPLARVALEAMAAAGGGYSNLEYDLDAGVRGSRYDHCAGLLAELTGAEAALVVNNAAAGLLLALTALARGRGVAVSRGELVEIGGGFRIPEILERSGARLVEVGSTNRTRVADYGAALERGDAHALLKVHRSNFSMSGFVEEASTPELAELAGSAGVPLVHDLGSGLFLDAGRLGLPPEPRPHDSLVAGVDVVVVSGDKLFGGPQAGILLGKAESIARLRRDPLCRALRVDKATLAGLEATARLYRNPERALSDIPTLAMLASPPDRLEGRARALAVALVTAGVPGVVVQEVEGRVGGGTYPGVTLPSWGVVLEPPEGAADVARALRLGDPPIVARIEGDRLVLDVRTILEEDEPGVLRGLLAALGVGAP